MTASPLQRRAPICLAKGIDALVPKAASVEAACSQCHLVVGRL